MMVSTDAGTWIVPPLRGVWVPAGTPHWIECRGAVQMRTVYVHAASASRLPRACRVVSVSPLLRELILYLAEGRRPHAVRGARARAAGVLLDQLRTLPVEPLYLPMPGDPRLRQLTDSLRRDPSDSRGLDAWGRAVGASRRTLIRQFQNETGLSFSDWRRQLRLVESLARLARGEPVTSVALDVGYDSPSAFISMFKSRLGCSPGQYFARR